MAGTKNILVLARRDHLEAMRVAAGLTIFGHAVRLVFMDRPVTQEIAASEQGELLELSGIEPETTVAAMAGDLSLLGPQELAEAMRESDGVVSL